jgi:hypothetical protein
MKKTVMVTQSALDKMTPAEISALRPDQVPEGYYVEVRENKAILVCEFDMANTVPAPEPTPEEPKPTFTEEIISPPPPPPAPAVPPVASKAHKPTIGVLFLRFFKKDTLKDKTLTRIQGKVYFPVKPIPEGWYVATVQEEHYKHGVMETMELSSIPVKVWEAQMIKGVFVERNMKEKLLKIYPSVPKAKLDKGEEPVCIHSIPIEIPEEPEYEGDEHRDTIANLITKCEQEAIERLKYRNSY